MGGTAPTFSTFRGSDGGMTMFRFAIIFLIISLVAGAVGMTNVSVLAKRISFIFFGLFFLGFLALLAFAYLLGAAFNAGEQSMLLAPMLA
jgi:uncharacterized membrane protein YtjA (UPF0391 family)